MALPYRHTVYEHDWLLSVWLTVESVRLFLQTIFGQFCSLGTSQQFAPQLKLGTPATDLALLGFGPLAIDPASLDLDPCLGLGSRSGHRCGIVEIWTIVWVLGLGPATDVSLLGFGHGSLATNVAKVSQHLDEQLVFSCPFYSLEIRGLSCKAHHTQVFPLAMLHWLRWKCSTSGKTIVSDPDQSFSTKASQWKGMLSIVSDAMKNYN